MAAIFLVVAEAFRYQATRDVYPLAGIEEVHVRFLSDIVLPDGNGLDFVERCLAGDAQPVVILASGYTDERSRWDAITEKKFPFLQKPYTPSSLARKVREVLDS